MLLKSKPAFAACKLISKRPLCEQTGKAGRNKSGNLQIWLACELGPRLARATLLLLPTPAYGLPELEGAPKIPAAGLPFFCAQGYCTCRSAGGTDGQLQQHRIGPAMAATAYPPRERSCPLSRYRPVEQGDRSAIGIERWDRQAPRTPHIPENWGQKALQPCANGRPRPCRARHGRRPSVSCALARNRRSPGAAMARAGGG